MHKKRLVFQSPILTTSGYGARGRDIAKCLLDFEEYQVYFIPTNWGTTPWTGLDENSQFGKEVKRKIVTQLDFKPDIYIQHTIPNEFRNIGEYNIGITAGIETDTCAPEWVDGINRMDMVIGSSNHSVEVLKKSSFNKVDKRTNQVQGVLSVKDNVRFEVLHEAVDLTPYKEVTNLSKNIKKSIDDIDSDFAFLFVGHWMNGDFGQDRKDVGGLIKTFITTFSKKPKSKQPALILKVSGGSFSITDKEIILNKIRQISGDLDKCPPIHLIYGTLSEKEMVSLYKHPKVKSMVSFTKGEGFGRPLAEFAVTGKPVVVSNWSGQTDFIKSDYHVLLDGALTDTHPSVHNNWFIKGSKWFTVNYSQASYVLKDIHKNYNKYLKNSKKGKRYIVNKLSFDKMKNDLRYILSNAQKEDKSNIKLNLPKLD